MNYPSKISWTWYQKAAWKTLLTANKFSRNLINLKTVLKGTKSMDQQKTPIRIKKRKKSTVFQLWDSSTWVQEGTCKDKKRAHPMNAYITMCNKRSCLQFHVSSPCAILFHWLAIFTKWNIILNKCLKHFTVLLLVMVPNVRPFTSWFSSNRKGKAGRMYYKLYTHKFLKKNHFHWNNERFGINMHLIFSSFQHIWKKIITSTDRIIIG